MPTSHKLVYAIYVFVWIIVAIDPKYLEGWLLENVLVFFIFPYLIWMDKKHNYSLLSIILFLLFASSHALGTHYTYAEMEHFDIITQFFGFERNHYDRVVHFLFGLLLFRLLFEVITPGIKSVKTALLFTFTMILTISTLYEMLEWLAAITFCPELGIAFAGTQGDVWDAQQDTLVAMIGALINMAFYKSYEKLLLTRSNQIE